MDWAGLIHQLQSWGPSALTGVLVVIVLHFIKKVDDNSKKEEERAEKLRADINKTLNSFGERLSIVEKDYVKNDFFFREMSGWKTEINRMSDLIVNQFMVFSQNIIQLLSQRTK
ncbi:MAG: hypothetical protein FWD47_12850 [Treponema sp.]|nr:hypothetical protein [Treponema sp.]